MSRFIKGESGNPTGRPVGSKNFITSAFREQVAALISVESILDDLAKCTPYQRAALKVKLLEFVQPKLKNIEVKDVNSLVSLLRMGAAERRLRIMELKQQINEPD